MTTIKVIPVKLKATPKSHGMITIDAQIIMHFPNGQPINEGDLVAGKVYEFSVDIPVQKVVPAHNWRFGNWSGK